MTTGTASDDNTESNATDLLRAPTVAGLVAEARASVAEELYVPRGDSTDWLLDMLNAAVRPPVRRVVLSSLEDFSNRNLAPVVEFLATLDQIQIALQVDAAFDDYELEAV